jgi:hypothetical protein
MLLDENHLMYITSYSLSIDPTIEDIKKKIDAALKFDIPIVETARKVIEQSDDIADALWNAAKDELADNNIGEIMNNLMNSAGKYYSELKSFTEDPSTPSSKPTFLWGLPLPNNISDNTAHNYESSVLGVTERMMTKAPYLVAKILKPSMVDGATKAIEEMIEIGKRKNIAINPQKVNTYSGTDLRRFTFTYTLIPANDIEYNDILRGLLAFKYHMSGDAPQNSLFVSQKSVFKISFGNKQIAQMLEIENVFFNLTAINISYGADGNMSMTHDGAVKQITLSLSFVERTPYYNKSKTSKEVKKA